MQLIKNLRKFLLKNFWKLTKKKLVKSEENLQRLSGKLSNLYYFLDGAYNINCGGCCYVAAVLAELLELDDVNYNVIVYCSDYYDFDDIDCSQYHYAINIYEDAIINGYDDDDDFMEYANVSSEKLLAHYKECSWNDYYDKNRNNYIRRLITKFYIDFTNDLREE